VHQGLHNADLLLVAVREVFDSRLERKVETVGKLAYEVPIHFVATQGNEVT